MLLPVRGEETGGGRKCFLFATTFHKSVNEISRDIKQYQRTQKIGEKDVPDGTPYLAMDGPGTLIMT
jgi:hypothetical protein